MASPPDQQELDRSRREEHATKLALAAVFLGTVGLFATPLFRRSPAARIRALDLAMLGLTTYRLGNILSYERIADPIREPFTERVPLASGGEMIRPRGAGARRALGELFACPICAGTWAAAGLVYGLHLFPRATRALMTIMSATAIAQLVKTTVAALTPPADR